MRWFAGIDVNNVIKLFIVKKKYALFKVIYFLKLFIMMNNVQK